MAAALNILARQINATDHAIAKAEAAWAALSYHERQTSKLPAFDEECPDGAGFWFSGSLMESELDQLRATQCALRLVDSADHNVGWEWFQNMLRKNGGEPSDTIQAILDRLRKVPSYTNVEDSEIGHISDDWWTIGPFPRSADGFGPDPVEQSGGAHRLPREVVVESGSHRDAKWVRARSVSDGSVIIDMRPFWRVYSTDGRKESTEPWQGWVRGHISPPASISSRQEFGVGCTGVHAFAINGVVHPGTPSAGGNDIIERGDGALEPLPLPTVWSTVSLSQGVHVLSARVTDRSNRIRCAIRSVPEFMEDTQMASFKVEHPPVLPDLVEGLLLSGGFLLPVLNMDRHRWLRSLKVVVSGRQWSLNQTHPVIAPGQRHLMRVHLTGIPTLSGQGTISPVACTATDDGRLVSPLELRISAPGFVRQKIQLVLGCRRSLGEAFSFTYVDHRGSINGAVAMTPMFQCPYFRCAVVVSLRVAKLTSMKQILKHTVLNATSGVRVSMDHAWTVTPEWQTGAEDGILQQRAALESLLVALEALSKHRIFCYKGEQCQIVADSNRVLLEAYGPSARSALLLAASMPDRTLGTLVAGLDEQPDLEISRSTLSTVDFAIASVLMRQRSWRNVVRVGHSLKGVPIIVHVHENAESQLDRIAGEDLRRDLSLFDGNLTILASDRQSRRWWRELSADLEVDPLGAGFFDDNVRQVLRILCQSDIQAFTPEYYTLRVHDPAIQSTKGGLTIVESCNRALPASITVDYLFDDVTWHHRAFLHTENVCQLKFHYPPGLSGSPGGSPFDWTNTSMVLIDGTHQDMEGAYDANATWCRVCTGECAWERCPSSTLSRPRGPWGGVAAVFAEPILIVYGASGSPAETKAALAAATLLANTLAASTERALVVSIISDTSLHHDGSSITKGFNLVLIGSMTSNKLLSRESLLGVLPSNSVDSVFSPLIQPASESLLFALLPSPLQATDHLALAILSHSASQLMHAVTFLSEASTDIPDFLMLGPDMSAAPSTAVEVIGHWDRNWDFVQHLAGGRQLVCPKQRRIGPRNGEVYCR